MVVCIDRSALDCGACRGSVSSLGSRCPLVASIALVIGQEEIAIDRSESVDWPSMTVGCLHSQRGDSASDCLNSSVFPYPSRTCNRKSA